MFIQRILSVLLVILANFCLNTAEGRTCILDYHDTFSKPCGYCGVCKMILQSQEIGVCDDHYLEESGLFRETQGSHCILKNHCENNKNLCKNDSVRFTGVCLPLFGTYLCKCKQGFFGKNCENADEIESISHHNTNYYKTSIEQLAVIHNVVFTPIFYIKDYATILISLQSTGLNLSVYIDNGREKLHYNEKKCKRKFTTKSLCKDLFNEVENIRICEGKHAQQLKQPRNNRRCLITLKVPFPRSFDKNRVIYEYIDGVARSNNPVQGNLETIKIEINNGFGNFFSKHVFEYTFKIINIHETSKPKTHCAPRVRLINCGASMKNMPKISRSTDMVILSSVNTTNPDYSVCQRYDKFVSLWKVWRIQENHDELKDLPLFKFFDKKVFVPNKRKLDYGVYKVQLNVMANLVDYIIPEKAYCYFKVIRTPIQTTILGGSMKTLYYKKPMTLNVFSSIVPDRYSLDKGIKVVYSWRCNDLHETFCKPFQTMSNTRKIGGPFKASRTYKFTVKTEATHKFGITLERPETQVINMTSSRVLNLAIFCLKNCGGSVFKSNPQEIVLLEVSSTQPIMNNETLHWKYKCVEDDINFQDVSTIQDRESSQVHLIIKGNKLKEGRKYVFLVVAGDSVSSAEIMVETDQSPNRIVCDVFPINGTKGETMFSVSCKSQVKDDGFPSLIYEFYDRYDNESIGRMVGYSSTGVIEKIILTRDRFFVRATNFFGTAKENLIKIKLSSPTKKLSPSLIKFENELNGQDYIYRIGLISAYSDLLGSRLFWSDEIQILLDHLTDKEAQPPDLLGAILLKNALSIAACNKLEATEIETDIFQCNSILSIAKIMHEVAQRMQISLSSTNSTNNWRILTTTRTKHFVDSILGCSDFVLKANFLTRNILNHVDVHECLKQSTYHTIITLDNLVYIIAAQMPLIKKQVFETTNIVLLVEEMGTHFDNNSVIRMSSELTKIRIQEGYKYYIQEVMFKQNPYWWGSGRKINTNVYSFQLNKGNKHVENPNIGRIVHFHLKVEKFKSHLVNGSVKQPDPKNKPLVNDLEVVVYRIDPEAYSETLIEFVNFIDKADIKVLIVQRERPDFDLMTAKATEITRLSRKFSFRMKRKTNTYGTSFYYMGILPGSKVNIGISVNYSFTVYGARCAVWKYRSWISGEKCTVNKSSDMERKLLVCSCTLLTLTIAGYVYNPVITYNPYSHLSLSLKIPENTLTVWVLLTTLLFFSVVSIWTKKKDKEDKKRKNVLVLVDNRTTDPFTYLVAVFTGSRFGAGTTSNVGIKLFGDKATSRMHVIISSRQQSILGCGGDDWFLLSTPQHLGSLSQIQLWIDYSGFYPNWFCRKVTVCDLKSCETSTFIVEKWFGVSMNGVCLEVVRKGAAAREVNSFRLLFFHNLIQGLREYHIYVSLFFKHPRSLITRTQRLSVALCCVLVAMVTTSLLLSLSTPMLEDYPSYDITTKIFVISVISSVSATVVSLITMHYFRKSYTIVGKKFLTRSDISLTKKNTDKIDKKKQSICLKLLYKYTDKYVSSCKIIPIGNIDNKMGLDENNFLRSVAWMVSLTVIIVSVYTVLMSSLTYGEVKRSMWLTSLLFTGLIGVFFVIPIKVFLTAVFLSLLKIRHFDLMSHNIVVKKFLEYGISERLMKVNEEYKSMCIAFFNSYISWHDQYYNRVKKRQYILVRIWISLYILEAVVLIGVIVWVMGAFETYKIFYANSAVCNTMLTVEMCANVVDLDLAFKKLKFNVHEYMLPKMYQTVWYNGDAISGREVLNQETGWMLGANARLIGDPHLIQVRVQENLCVVPKMMSNLTRTCLPSLSSSTVDRDNYSLSWRHDDWSEIDLFSESPWEFVQGSGIGVRTPSNYYLRDGGYIAALLRTLDAAKFVYTNLLDTNWIDHQTRVIVLEFVTYNVNNNMITSSYFITEMYPTNIVNVAYTIRSKQHYRHQISFQGKLFIFLSLYFIFRTLVLINIMGIGNFFANFWNLYDVFFSILYFVATVKYIQLLYLLGVDEEKAKTIVINRHVYLEVLFEAEQDTKIYICYTFGVAAMRLIRIARINESVKRYLSDFIDTRTELVLTVFLSFSSMYIMFRLVMYYLEPPTVYDFMDILVFQSDFTSLAGQYDDYTGKLSAYILGRLSDITMFSFTISLLHHQRQIKMRRISLIQTP